MGENSVTDNVFVRREFGRFGKDSNLAFLSIYDEKRQFNFAEYTMTNLLGNGLGSNTRERTDSFDDPRKSSSCVVNFSFGKLFF